MEKKIWIYIIIGILLFSALTEPPIKKAGQKVIFRTNAVNGDYEGNSVWIAVDANNDGVLEGFGYKGYSSYDCNAEEKMVSSPENYIVCSRSGYDLLSRIYLDTGDKGLIFESSASVAANAVLSTSPTEPYASNNQEVYEFVGGDGKIDYSCVDENNNNKIDFAEFIKVANAWLSDII